MIPKTALLIGATGQVGQFVLKELLASPEWTRVGEFGRRVTDAASLPSEGKDKLVQKTINFEKLDEAGLKDEKWDVVIITLGTTRKLAGSAEQFEKIDREYVINAANAAKTDGPQRLVYVSAVGANASSPMLYSRSKGLTELGLAGLEYDDTIIFRPGYLAGVSRSDFRPLEHAFSIFTKVASCVTDSAEIDIRTLAKSIVGAAKLGSSALPASAQAQKAGKEGNPFTLIHNAGALNFFKTS